MARLQQKKTSIPNAPPRYDIVDDPPLSGPPPAASAQAPLTEAQRHVVAAQMLPAPPHLPPHTPHVPPGAIPNSASQLYAAQWHLTEAMNTLEHYESLFNTLGVRPAAQSAYESLARLNGQAYEAAIQGLLSGRLR